MIYLLFTLNRRYFNIFNYQHIKSIAHLIPTDWNNYIPPVAPIIPKVLCYVRRSISGLLGKRTSSISPRKNTPSMLHHTAEIPPIILVVGNNTILSGIACRELASFSS